MEEGDGWGWACLSGVRPAGCSLRALATTRNSLSWAQGPLTHPPSSILMLESQGRCSRSWFPCPTLTPPPPPGVHKCRNTQQARESPWEVEVGVVCFPGGRALLKPASVPRKAPHPLLNQGFLLAVRKKLQSIREMNFLWKQLPCSHRP